MRRSDLFINDGSGQTVEESKLLRKALDSLADGVLVVDRNMVVRHANPQFLEMWRIPESVASSRDNELLLAYVGDQLEDPDGFVALVREVTAGNKRHSEEIRFRDGRIFSSYSAPIMVSGCVRIRRSDRVGESPTRRVVAKRYGSESLGGYRRR